MVDFAIDIVDIIVNFAIDIVVNNVVVAILQIIRSRSKLFFWLFKGEKFFDVFAKAFAEKEVDEGVVSSWGFDKQTSDHSINWKEKKSYLVTNPTLPNTTKTNHTQPNWT